MSNQDTIHPHPDDTTYTWSVIVKPASGYVINGFWMAHICNNLSTPPLSLLGSQTINLSTSTLYSYSHHNDGWTFFYMDSNNCIWVYPTYQAGISGGEFNAPDYSGTLTITVDPGTNSLQLSFDYMDGTQPGNRTYTASNFVQYTALS